MSGGAFILADLRSGMCRYACTPDDVPKDQHRFRGAKTFIGPGNRHGSWCPDHLRVVWGQGTREERRAGDYEQIRKVA